MIQKNVPAYFESNEIITLAEYYAEKGRINMAERVIDYGITLYPDDLDILLYKCHNLTIRGKLAEAHVLLDSIPDKNDREVILMQARILLEEQETKQADNILLSLYKQEQDLDTMLDIADLYMDSGLHKEAYNWLLKAYAMAPDETDVLESFIDYHFSFGNFQEATVFLNKLLDKNPYEIRHWLDLTKAYLQLNNIEKASEAVDFALTIDSDSPEALELKGHCLMQEGKYEETCRLFSRVEQMVTDKSRIRHILLNCYLVCMDFQKALTYCNLLIQEPGMLNTELSEFFQKRAQCYLFLDNLKQCEADIEASLLYNDQNDEAYLTKGEMLLSIEKEAEAEQAFSKAKQWAFDLGETIIRIARAYFRWNYIKEALQTFAYVEQNFPKKMESDYYFMAFCYYVLGEEKNMFKYLVRGAVNHPATLAHNPIIPSNDAEQEFFKYAEIVATQIREGNIDPTPYL